MFWRILIIAILFFGAAAVFADDLSNDAPWVTPPCVAYHPNKPFWGAVNIHAEVREHTLCPTHHAIVGLYPVLGDPDGPSNIPVSGFCCPLPPDALSEEHVEDTEACPEDYVATGSRIDEQYFLDLRDSERDVSNFMQSYRQILRCTKINTKRYSLSEPSPLVYWGLTTHFGRMFEKRISRSQIPIGLRYGIGRTTRYHWARDGCVTYPFGSLLTKKTGKECSQLFSRQLLYRGRRGDPASGTPVVDYSGCLAVDDPLSPKARCVRW